MSEKKKEKKGGLLGQLKDVQEMFALQQTTASKSHDQGKKVLALEKRRARAVERIANALEELVVVMDERKGYK